MCDRAVRGGGEPSASEVVCDLDLALFRRVRIRCCNTWSRDDVLLVTKPVLKCEATKLGDCVTRKDRLGFFIQPPRSRDNPFLPPSR